MVNSKPIATTLVDAEVPAIFPTIAFESLEQTLAQYKKANAILILLLK